MKISIIITAKNEVRTIGQAVEGFLDEGLNSDDYEIIVVAPDRETLKKARLVSRKVKVIQDNGVGKAHAMNLAIREAWGDVLIFSDGDVRIQKNAVRNLVKNGGDAVSGRPDYGKINKDKRMFDFFQYVLFEKAHEIRLKRDTGGKFLLLSGYLFSVKRELLAGFKFPDNLLTEDEYLSYYLYHSGARINYEPTARVIVKGPSNYRDWVAQKVRTLAGGYQMPSEWKKGVEMRSFLKESLGLCGMWIRYVRSFRQVYYMSRLNLARVHVWLLAFIKVRLLKKKSSELWVRIGSTK
jgi:cellulose synthase/poly-beta-1,6-N-acetylglucosamine synthase-like glycosyltransferase